MKIFSTRPRIFIIICPRFFLQLLCSTIFTTIIFFFSYNTFFPSLLPTPLFCSISYAPLIPFQISRKKNAAFLGEMLHFFLHVLERTKCAKLESRFLHYKTRALSVRDKEMKKEIFFAMQQSSLVKIWKFSCCCPKYHAGKNEAIYFVFSLRWRCRCMMRPRCFAGKSRLWPTHHDRRMIFSFHNSIFKLEMLISIFFTK